MKNENFQKQKFDERKLNFISLRLSFNELDLKNWCNFLSLDLNEQEGKFYRIYRQL